MLHKELTNDRWSKFSLFEQLGNIGSEVGRARIYQGKDPIRFEGAVKRAMELFYLTLADKRWTNRLKEIGRARDVFCDAITGGYEYDSNLVDLEKYFMQFALAARVNK